MAWLSVRYIDDKEFRGDFFDALTLLEEGWDHLVGLGLPHYKLLTIFRVCEDVRIDQSLALVTDHVAVDFDVVIFGLDNHSHELGYLKVHWVIKREHLLALSSLFDLILSKDGVLVNLCEDCANTL